MLRLLPLLSLLVDARKISGDEPVVTVTSWCSNSARLRITPPGAAAPLSGWDDKIPSALIDTCPGAGKDAATLSPGGRPITHGSLTSSLSADGVLSFSRGGTVLFSAAVAFGASTTGKGFVAVNLTTTPGDTSERIFGLGEGNFTNEGGCPSGEQRVVPLQRNGQRMLLLQRKFFITIPFAYSSSGYGLLFNMPGKGSVSVGELDIGGMAWAAEAATALDIWVTTLPTASGAAPVHHAAPIYSQYADATGHAPPLREDAMIFWQSRNRYKSSAIAEAVAERYQRLKLPVGVLVIDYRNQVHDGDYAPDPTCYPSVSNLSAAVRSRINATLVYSFWPEVQPAAAEYATLKAPSLNLPS